MLLLQHPLSPYAQKVRIALREKGQSFEARLPTRLAPGQSSDETAVTPRVEFPVLINGNIRIFDSTIILQYLEDVFPDPPLLPSGPAERARARMIEDICDTHYEAINWGLSEIKFFGRGGASLGPKLREKGIEQIRHIHAWLSQQLGDRTWFDGDRFGWSDLSVVPYVASSSTHDVPPVPNTALSSWLDRVMQRPSVAATIEEARAALPAMADAAERLRRGEFKRQYRDHRLEWMIRSGGMQVVLDGIANNDIRFTDTGRFPAHGIFS
jgi:glutathione S-transferase